MAATSRESATERGDSITRKGTGSRLVRDDALVVHSVSLGAIEDVGMFGHGRAADGTGELGIAGAGSFDLIRRVRKLAAHRGVRSKGGLELALGLLGGGLAFGESSLEAGLFGDMRVGGGHGQEAEEREGK